ncbi:MAG: PAS domain S-box protein [Acidobacteria bacterium]|nr:PAS domain S-box protein [Acidobacteriota bacterium]
MAERLELLESALDAFAEAAAVVDLHGQLAFWNRAAEMLTGYRAGEVVGKPVRDLLNQIVAEGAMRQIRSIRGESSKGGIVIRIRHALGHDLPVMAQVRTLRDAVGARIGSEAIFHPADSIDSLPHGESDENLRISQSQTQLEDRLLRLHEDFARGGLPLGVLWISVDQAFEMRRSRGSSASEAMLEAIERTLASGLKPTEEIGRWGNDDYLVLSHERSAAALANHAQTLAGLARTAEFRWWGDRISLTVSIGAAQAIHGEELSALLERAQSAMIASIHAGGNHISAAQEKS